ncbi:MAG TPA: MFS transporter [Candidatus Limnocylindria bacterium]|nr:MFS transporter [Candidatus Limnocylindria bacterium]
MTDPNWMPSRVRRNFRIDLFSALGAGAFVSVLVAFMPVVVRRMGGSTTDVALVVAGPFIGNLLSPVFAYLMAHLPVVRAVAGASTLSRAVFLVSVLIAATPFALAVTSAVFWIIAVSNIAAYTALMQGIYPDRERAFAMGNVRVGASVAGIAAAALAGSFIDVVPAQWVFAAAALIGLPCAASFFLIRYDGPATPPARRPARAIARDVWADHRYRKLLLAFTLFGTGNLMNFAVFPILLVDHFDASNGFVGMLAIVQSAAQIVAYPIVGRMIDRGSTLRLSLVSALLTILVPIGYLTAPGAWMLLPVAAIIGISVSSGELTGFTNIVHLAPRGRISEYAAAQALLLGVRGTSAPFVAAAFLGMVQPQVVLVLGTLLMTTGALVLAQVVRAPAPVPVKAVPAEA